MGGARPRLHLWCKSGMSFPPGWPQRAPALAARFAPVIDGIIHVPRVNRMPIGENREACLALGLGGGACATHVEKDATDVTLGFDAVARPCCMTGPGDLSPWRMALAPTLEAV